MQFESYTSPPTSTSYSSPPSYALPPPSSSGGQHVNIPLATINTNTQQASPSSPSSLAARESPSLSRPEGERSRSLRAPARNLRVHTLSWWHFALILLLEFYQNTAIIFLSIFPDVNDVYITYTFTTIVRAVAYLYTSYRISQVWWRYYLVVDSLLALSSMASITYVFLNSEASGGWAVPAIISYVVLLNIYNGHYRCMVYSMRWTRTYVILYKLNRLYGALFYLAYGTYVTLNPPDNLNSNAYLIFIFTTLAYLSELYFTIVGMDKSEECSLKHLIEDEE